MATLTVKYLLNVRIAVHLIARPNTIKTSPDKETTWPFAGTKPIRAKPKKTPVETQMAMVIHMNLNEDLSWSLASGLSDRFTLAKTTSETNQTEEMRKIAQARFISQTIHS